MIDLTKINLNDFKTDDSKFSFVVMLLRPELQEEGRGFNFINPNGSFNLSNVEWVGEPPSTLLTDEEIQLKINELFNN